MDSDHTFHLQSRSNLLKSLFLGDDDVDYELGEYTSSLINLLNKGLYEENWVDRFFINTSYSLLKDEDVKRRILDLDSFREMEEGLSSEGEEARRKKREGVKEGAFSGSIRDEAPNHRWVGRHVVGRGSMASKVPRVTTDKGSYNLNPFSSEIHPLWKKNPTSGYPDFVHMLEDYYLSSEDDVPISQRHGEIEMRHNAYHKKKDSVALGNQYLGDLSALGEGHGALEHSLYERAYSKWKQDNREDVDKMISEGANHKDVRRAHFRHAADEWVGDNFQEVMGSNLRDNELYKDIQKLMREGKFNNEEDAMDYLVNYQNPDKYNQSQIDNYNKEQYPHGERERHSHKLGWMGFNLGLEWLSPKEREDVIGHLMEHGSDGEEDHQTHITLDDGVKIPMGRFKRNLIKRATPEMLWAIGSPDRALPNTNAHPEHLDDDITPHKGNTRSVGKARINRLNDALTSTSKYIIGKDDEGNPIGDEWNEHVTSTYGGRKTVTKLDQSILNQINERLLKAMYGEDFLGENPEKLEKLRDKNRLDHLPLTENEASDIKNKHQELVKKALHAGDFHVDYDSDPDGFISPEEANKLDARLLHSVLKTFSSNVKRKDRRHVFHSGGSREDLENHYLSNDKEKSHPIHDLFKNTKKNPLIEPKELEELDRLLDRGLTHGDSENQVRTDMQPFSRIKGPTREHAGETEGHFEDTLHGLEGLQSFWAHPYQRGALSIAPETYADFLFNLMADPDNPDKSLFGHVGEKGKLTMSPEMVGLFGLLNPEGLPSRQGFSNNPSQVLSIHNASSPTSLLRVMSGRTAKISRNNNNHNMTEHSRVSGLTTKVRTGKVKIPRSMLGYNLSDTGLHPVTNPTTRMAQEGMVTDTNIARNSSSILRDGILRGIGHKPGDKDPATGRTLLGSPSMMYTLSDLFSGKVPLEKVGDESGLLEFIAQGKQQFGSLFDESERLEIDDIDENIEEILEQLNDSLQREREGMKEIDGHERDRLTQSFNELQEQKRIIMESVFDENYDPSETSNRKPLHDLSRHVEEKRQDAHVTHEIAREYIIPGMKKANPDAFPLDNPAQFLIDSAQALHDAELFMLHSSHDIHGMSGLSLLHQQKEDDSIQTKQGQSYHKQIAASVRDFGIPLDGSLSADDVLEKLGIGISNYEEYLEMGASGISEKQGKKYLGKLYDKTGRHKKRLRPSDMKAHISHVRAIQEAIDSGKTHVSTMGNILAQRDDLPEGVTDHASMVEHYNDVMSRAATSRGGENYGTGINPSTDKTHPLHRDTGRFHQLLNLSTDEEMENWGLGYHKIDKNVFGSETRRLQTSSGNIGKPNKEALPNKTKRLMNHIISYDEGSAPDLDEISNVGKVTRDEISHNLVPMNSVRSNEGMNSFSFHSSSAQQLHNGKSMLPASSAMSIDRNGNPTWGVNTQPLSLIPASEEGLINMHGQDAFTTLQNTANEQGLDTMFRSSASNLQRVSGENPMPESVNFYDFSTSFDKIPHSDLLKNLPKEMPLLDPYHKVFDYEDIEELRGFTGDWAVTALEVGDRVKVTRKGTFVEVKSEDGKKVGLSDNMRSSIRKLGSKSFTMDGVLNHRGLFMIDLMYYDDTDVTDMDVRERMKLLRSQFDSHEDVFVPSPSTLRMTDEEGLEEAIKYLRSENKDCKILIRDAKSTYMKGEEKHPKWILLTKADDDFHVPFSMELDNDAFIINYEHDIVKFDIVDEEPVNPRAIMGELSQSNYTLNLTKSLEKYWRPAFYDMLKEEEDILPEDREEEVEDNSGGLLKPKKNSTLILKPNVLKNILEVLERSMDALEKGHTPMSGGKGLGIDVGSDIESPRGPTKLTNEAALPDWDMKERPEQDPEKPEKYPNREKKALETKRSE